MNVATVNCGLEFLGKTAETCLVTFIFDCGEITPFVDLRQVGQVVPHPNKQKEIKYSACLSQGKSIPSCSVMYVCWSLGQLGLLQPEIGEFLAQHMTSGHELVRTYCPITCTNLIKKI